MKIKKTHKLSGWELRFYSHDSRSTQTEMKFSVFLPQGVEKIDSAIIWLSGLTCSEENFMAKSGIGEILRDTSTMIICPDTSPRWLDLPWEHESYDFGSGAGFYVNATTDWYKDHYQMYDYVNQEIYNMLIEHFDISDEKISIMGHSMWWHGALILWLKNPDKYQSVSAFSPIVNPSSCPWWQKAFTGYLWEDKGTWKQYDACELINSWAQNKNPILIDQWTVDEFLKKELLTQNFVEACKAQNQDLELHMREWYDHSYYFISSFLKHHIEFHLKNI